MSAVSPKKILHITEPFSAGVFTSISNLVIGLPDYAHFVLHGSDRLEKNIPALSATLILWKYVGVSLHPLKDFLALLGAMRTIQKIKPDIIHLHSSKAGFLGRCGAFLLGYSKKVIYTPHGISFLRKDISDAKRAFFQYLEYFAFFHFSGKVIACSPSEQKEIQKANISCSCIPNGVTISAQVEVQRPATKIFTVGTMGHIRHPQKGVDTFNQIAAHFQDIQFVWIGDGGDRVLLTSPNIKITGWLSKEALKTQIEDVDIYLSTSLWEGLPYSVLEAMAAAKPILLSNCVGHLDLITSSGEAFETLSEAICRIQKWTESIDLLHFSGQTSLEKIKNNFSIAQYLKAYDKEYSQLAEF